jgi:hypothetical protein
MKYTLLCIIIVLFGCTARNKQQADTAADNPGLANETKSAVHAPPFFSEKAFAFFKVAHADLVLPEPLLYTQLWWSFYDADQQTLGASTDLNDDRQLDYAFFVERSDTINLLILLSNSDTYTSVLAPDFIYPIGENNFRYGIQVVPPGQIDCVVDGQEKSLILKSNAIALLEYEEIIHIYHWTGSNFETFGLK